MIYDLVENHLMLFRRLGHTLFCVFTHCNTAVSACYLTRSTDTETTIKFNIVLAGTTDRLRVAFSLKTILMFQDFLHMLAFKWFTREPPLRVIYKCRSTSTALMYFIYVCLYFHMYFVYEYHKYIKGVYEIGKWEEKNILIFWSGKCSIGLEPVTKK